MLAHKRKTLELGIRRVGTKKLEKEILSLPFTLMRSTLFCWPFTLTFERIITINSTFVAQVTV